MVIHPLPSVTLFHTARISYNDLPGSDLRQIDRSNDSTNSFYQRSVFSEFSKLPPIFISFSTLLRHISQLIRFSDKFKMRLTFANDFGQTFTVEIDSEMELENVMALLEAEASSSSSSIHVAFD